MMYGIIIIMKIWYQIMRKVYEWMDERGRERKGRERIFQIFFQVWNEWIRIEMEREREREREKRKNNLNKKKRSVHTNTHTHSYINDIHFLLCYSIHFFFVRYLSFYINLIWEKKTFIDVIYHHHHHRIIISHSFRQSTTAVS